MYYILSSSVVIAGIALVVLSILADKKLSAKTNMIISAILVIFFIAGFCGAVYISAIFKSNVNNVYNLISEDFASWADDTFYVIFKWETILAAAVFAAASLISLIKKKTSVIGGISVLVSDILLLIIAPVYAFMTENKNADIKTYILTYTLFLCLVLLSENTICFIKTFIKQKNRKTGTDNEK